VRTCFCAYATIQEGGVTGLIIFLWCVYHVQKMGRLIRREVQPTERTNHTRLKADAARLNSEKRVERLKGCRPCEQMLVCMQQLSHDMYNKNVCMACIQGRKILRP